MIFIFFAVLKEKINIRDLTEKIRHGDHKALARAITIVENDLAGAEELMQSLKLDNQVPVVGFTGPPGAGKSSLVNVLLKKLSEAGKKTGVIAVDPTSPFNFGSLLGDRLRMAELFTSENVFIRSMATRGSLGGLAAKTIEVTDLYKSAPFDYIIVESVGVGQSEVEIAGLADVTVVVLVPESGDEIQTLKSGVMEIADIFIVNKSDRAGADSMVSNIKLMLNHRPQHPEKSQPPVLKTIASTGEGTDSLLKLINEHIATSVNEKKYLLLAEKAYQLIQKNRMKDINKMDLQEKVKELSVKKDFNIYRFVANYQR